MTKLNKKHFILMFILAIACAVFFGCGQEVIVEGINFADKNIVLLVGESYTPNVDVYPSYSSGYELTSLNTAVATISNGKINAISEGTATIKVVATDNRSLEDVMTIRVLSNSVTLESPTVNYNAENQTIYFSPVANAVGYTLKINNNTIDLGNYYSYSLARLQTEFGSAYDNVLNISVKANAPTYTRAFVESNYSASKAIYQVKAIENVSVVGGVLHFDVNSSASYSFSINDDRLMVGDYSAGVNLTDITNYGANLAKYAGKNATLKVVAERAVEGAEVYPATASLPVYILDAPNRLEFSGDVVSWNNVLNASKYTVLLDSEKVKEVNTNFVDLTSLENDKYNEIEAGHTYTLKIESAIALDSKNILGCGKFISQQISRKPTLDLTPHNNIVWWPYSSNRFEATISYDDKVETFALVNSQLNLDSYAGGKTYKIKVKTLGNLERDGIYYLPGKESETSITKQLSVELSYDNISEKVLTFTASADDSFKAYLDEENEETLNNNAGTITFDLSRRNIAEGTHTINVKRAGNNREIFDSDVTTLTFIQLGQINNIEIINSHATIVRSEANQNGMVVFTIKKNVGGEKTIELETENSALIDSENDDFYTAGLYTISVAIKGDNKRVFTAPTSEYNIPFNVLDIPTLSILSTNASEINFAGIDNASEYNVFEDGSKKNYSLESEGNYKFNIIILDGETKKYKVQTIGDGVHFLNSKVSDEFVVSRLSRPTVKYNNETNHLEISGNDENLLTNPQHMVTVNGVSVDEGSSLNLLEGTNVVKAFANAVNQYEGVNYLSSTETEITIEKIEAATAFSVVDNQKIKLTRNPNVKTRYKLYVEITTTQTGYIFDEKDNKLTSRIGNVDLPLSYEDDCYIITLENNFEKLIPNEDNELTIKVKYLADGFENVANSEQVTQTISYLQKTTLSREGQNIVVSNLTETRDVDNYAMLINGEYLPLNNAIKDGQNIKVDIALLDEFLTSSPNEVKVVTLNFDYSEKLTLASISEPIYVERAGKIELISTKDNEDRNNSVVVSVNALDVEYDLIYVFEITDGEGSPLTTLKFSKGHEKNGLISFDLDEKLDKVLEEFKAEINISAHVETVGSYENEKIVQVFNSLDSNTINLTMVEAATELYIENNHLKFTESISDYVEGYDIYVDAGTGELTKVNAHPVTTNDYDLNDYVGKLTGLAVRAIASSELAGYTNSLLSLKISAIKLSNPDIKIVNGDVVLTLPNEAQTLLDSEIEAEILISIKNGETILNLSELKQNTDDSFIIEPNQFLTYLDINLQTSESVDFKILVNLAAGGETYYLNSDPVTLQCTGIFSPTKVDVSAEQNLETIVWTKSENNMLDDEDITAGFVFKIEYEGVIYYSNDENLVYKQNDEFIPYDAIINGESAPFPYGYKVNGDKTDCEIVFGSGEYKISVKTVPLNLDGHNFVCSDYITVIKTIIPVPKIWSSDGCLKWNSNDLVQEYRVVIYDDTFKQVKKDFRIPNDNQIISFDFSSNDNEFDNFYGIFGITVQAISKTEDVDVVDSLATEMFYVYRMKEASGAFIDDGAIVLEANDLFSSAQLTFSNGKTSTTIDYFRPLDAEQARNDLKIASWKEAEGKEIGKEKNIIVNFSNNNTILSLVEGGDFTTLSVRLIGNSFSEISTGSLVILNSKVKTITDLKSTKLKSSLYEIAKGSYKFKLDGHNANSNFNHQFIADVEDEFVKKAPIFKINLTIGEKIYDFYAIDYDYFIAQKGTLSQDAFEEIKTNGLYATYIYNHSQENKMYFNVFENNIINFNNTNFNFYPLRQTIEKSTGIFEYSSEGLQTINLLDGGVFTIYSTVLGGDSFDEEGILHGYLTSNNSTTFNYIRYETIKPDGEDGLIKFKNLQPKRGALNVDYPVYELQITPNNAEITYYIYLYYAGNYYNGGALNAAKEISTKQGTTDKNPQFVAIDQTNIVEGFVVFDITKYISSFSYSNYTIKIRTYANKGSGNSIVGNIDESYFLLDAKIPDYAPYPCHELDSVKDLAVESGELSATLVSVNESDGERKIYNYEFTIEQEEQTFVYRVNMINDPNVRISNGKFYYTIPSVIEYNESQFELNFDSQYRIKARAMAGDDSSLLNGDYYKKDGQDAYVEFFKAPTILSENVRVAGGILVWDAPVNASENTTYSLRIIVDEVHSITISKLTANEYKFLDGYYAIDNSSEPIQLNGSQNLTVQVRVEGKDNYIDSDYGDPTEVQRLKQISTSSVVSLDGVLTWEEIGGAVSYVVTLNDSLTFTTQINSLDFATTLDDEGNNIEVNTEYKIKIRAIGDDRLTSMPSAEPEQTFKKLESVNVESIKIVGKTVTFNAVDGALGYRVIVNEEEPITLGQGVTTFDLSDNIVGEVQIKITALGVGECYVFNSDESTYGGIERPNSVREVLYDGTNNVYYWQEAEDAEQGDTFLIGYDFEEYYLSGSSIEKHAKTTLSSGDFKQYTDGSVTYYYFEPTVMGEYSNFSVIVVRDGVYSTPTILTDLNAIKLFSVGAGTEEKPYVINNANELLNVEKKPDKHYQLNGTIDLTEYSNTLLARVSLGYIVANEFSGVFDGSEYKYAIILPEITLSNTPTFALFKTLNNATIKNLIIGSRGGESKITASYNTNTQIDEIVIATLASSASNCTISNVNVLNYQISISQTNQISNSINADIYIAGLIGKDKGSTITNCNVNLSVDYRINSAKNRYVAGVIAKAENTKINSNSKNEVEFAATCQEGIKISYLGGVVAYFTASGQECGVFNTNVKFSVDNVGASNEAGIVAHAENITISGCSVNGTIKETLNQQINLGGFVGEGNNVNFSNSTCSIVFSLYCRSTSNNICVGAIAGKMTGGEEEGCNVNTEKERTQLVSNSNAVIGKYGTKD